MTPEQRERSEARFARAVASDARLEAAIAKATAEGRPAVVVTGQLLRTRGEQVRLYMNGTLDERRGVWLDRKPLAMPEMQEGTCWRALLDRSVEWYEQLKKSPDALTDFEVSEPPEDCELDDFLERLGERAGAAR